MCDMLPKQWCPETVQFNEHLGLIYIKKETLSFILYNNSRTHFVSVAAETLIILRWLSQKLCKEHVQVLFHQQNKEKDFTQTSNQIFSTIKICCIVILYNIIVSVKQIPS